MAKVLPSGAHCRSSQWPSLLQLMSSHRLDRRCCGGSLRRTTLREATSTTTGSIMNTLSSPGSGYFHASSSGWPTLVLTVYISPTPRWSCW